MADFHKERFDRTDAKLDCIMETLETVTMRLSSLEEQTSLHRRETNLLREDFVRLEHRIDGMDRRVRKIEKRLDLIDA